MDYEFCMKRKCKECKKKIKCDNQLKYEALTYRPFEEYFKKLKENKANEIDPSYKTIQW